MGTKTAFAVVSLLAVSSMASALLVSDRSFGTKNELDVPVTFTGNDLSITSAEASDRYNLTRGSEVLRSVFGNSLVDTSGLEEGRYVLNNTNDTTNQTRLDIVSDGADVVGRINASESEVDIEVLSWLEGAELGTDQYNVSTSSWPTSQGSQTLYRLNVSTDRYWVKVNRSGDLKAEPARFRLQNDDLQNPDIGFPRTNDIEVAEGGNLSGRILFANGSAINQSGIDVKLERNSLLNSNAGLAETRIPYFRKPPIITDDTDQNGFFNFSGLQRGSYTLEVTSVDFARLDHPFLEANAVRSGTENRIDLRLTPNTGNVSARIQGSPGRGERLAILVEKTENDRDPRVNTNGVVNYLSPVAEVGSPSDFNVPNGSYKVFAAKFVDGEAVATDTTFTSVGAGEETPILNLSFPQLVNVTGVVTGPEGPVENIRVSFNNDSEEAFYDSETNENGRYSLRVQNGTSYDASVIPDARDGVSDKTKQVDVDGSVIGGPANFSLDRGPFVNGIVVDSAGEPLDEARVEFVNFTQNVFGEGVTDDKGQYIVAGLKEDTNYSVEIITECGLRYRDSAELEGRNSTRDFTIDRNTHDLRVNVTDFNGNSIESEVEISQRFGCQNIEKTIDGPTNFSLKEGSYEVAVDPVEPDLDERSPGLFLDTNQTLEIKIPRTETTSGYIKDSSGDPIDVAFMSAFNGSLESFTFESVRDGKYELSLPRARHEIEIRPQGVNLQDKEAVLRKSEIGTSGNNFTLSEGETLSGVVKTAGGRKLEASVYLSNDSENSNGLDITRDGRFQVGGLADVGHTAYVRVDKPGLASSSTFEVGRSNFTNGRNFTLGNISGPKLRVKVELEEGEPVENATVQIRGNGVNEKAFTGNLGVAEFGRQPQGTIVDIRAFRDDTNTSLKTVKVDDGSGRLSSDVEIQNESLVLSRLNRSARQVEFNVTRDGSLVSGATAVARLNQSSGLLKRSDVTDANGKGTFENLPPGQYVVSISDEDSSGFNQTAELRTAGKISKIGKFSIGIESVGDR